MCWQNINEYTHNLGGYGWDPFEIILQSMIFTFMALILFFSTTCSEPTGVVTADAEISGGP